MPTFNNNDSLNLSTTKIDDISTVGGAGPVSYTHLDVYKRQE